MPPPAAGARSPAWRQRGEAQGDDGEVQNMACESVSSESECACLFVCLRARVLSQGGAPPQEGKTRRRKAFGQHAG